MCGVSNAYSLDYPRAKAVGGVRLDNAVDVWLEQQGSIYRSGSSRSRIPFPLEWAPLEHPSGRPPDEEHQRHDDDTQRCHQQEAILVGRHGGFEDELPLHQAQ